MSNPILPDLLAREVEYLKWYPDDPFALESKKFCEMSVSQAIRWSKLWLLCLEEYHKHDSDTMPDVEKEMLEVGPWCSNNGKQTPCVFGRNAEFKKCYREVLQSDKHLAELYLAFVEEDVQGIPTDNEFILTAEKTVGRKLYSDYVNMCNQYALYEMND